jgi:hypothetical protein|tara:strand:+ start:112 stop:264 length:153 start_codon:yes stop_codon:yes gene_type:complete
MNKTAMPFDQTDRAKLPPGGLKIADPTDKEKLFTIDEQLKVSIDGQAPPF